MSDKLKKLALTIAALAALAAGGAAISAATDSAGGGSNQAAEREDGDGDQGEQAGDDAGEHGDDAGDRGDGELQDGVEARAARAAVDQAGPGKAGEVEAGDEKGAAYEVELTKPDGSKLDVFLDKNLKVIATHSDRED